MGHQKQDIDPNATSGEDYGKNAGRKKKALPPGKKKAVIVENKSK